MEGFWKPGLFVCFFLFVFFLKFFKGTALPGSVDDKDDGDGNTVVWNPNASLSIQKQRIR